MSETKTATQFKKDYMPGYTGHLPTRQVRFGVTSGQMKREIVQDQGFFDKYYTRLQDTNNQVSLNYF